MIHKGKKMKRHPMNKEIIKNFDLFGMAPKMLDCIKKYFSDGTRILDVGTGRGIATRYLASQIKDAPNSTGKVYSIDLSDDLQQIVAEILEEEQTREYVEFQIADIEKLPYENSYFSLIVAMNCLHHFPNPSKAIMEMIRVLKREGTLCVIDYTKEAKFVPHKMEDLIDLVDFKRMGFNIVEEYSEEFWWFAAIKI